MSGASEQPCSHCEQEVAVLEVMHNPQGFVQRKVDLVWAATGYRLQKGLYCGPFLP